MSEHKIFFFAVLVIFLISKIHSAPPVKILKPLKNEEFMRMDFTNENTPKGMRDEFFNDFGRDSAGTISKTGRIPVEVLPGEPGYFQPEVGISSRAKPSDILMDKPEKTGETSNRFKFRNINSKPRKKSESASMGAGILIGFIPSFNCTIC